MQFMSTSIPIKIVIELDIISTNFYSSLKSKPKKLHEPIINHNTIMNIIKKNYIITYNTSTGLGISTAFRFLQSDSKAFRFD